MRDVASFLANLQSETALPVLVLFIAVGWLSLTLFRAPADSMALCSSDRMRWRLVGLTAPGMALGSGWLLFAKAPHDTSHFFLLLLTAAITLGWSFCCLRLGKAPADTDTAPKSDSLLVVARDHGTTVHGGFVCGVTLGEEQVGDLKPGGYLELTPRAGEVQLTFQTTTGVHHHATTLPRKGALLVQVRSDLNGFRILEERLTLQELPRFLTRYRPLQVRYRRPHESDLLA